MTSRRTKTAKVTATSAATASMTSMGVLTCLDFASSSKVIVDVSVNGFAFGVVVAEGFRLGGDELADLGAADLGAAGIVAALDVSPAASFATGVVSGSSLTGSAFADSDSWTFFRSSLSPMGVTNQGEGFLEVSSDSEETPLLASLFGVSLIIPCSKLRSFLSSRVLALVWSYLTVEVWFHSY